ncbi:hypothetical protein ACQ4LE_003051 [Meloidogyne hapla]
MSGAARALHWQNQRACPTPKGAGKPLKICRDWDRKLQLFSVNEEFQVSASHQLALITSLPPILCRHLLVFFLKSLAMTCKRVVVVALKALGVHPAGASTSADLGGSSKYSSEILED